MKPSSRWDRISISNSVKFLPADTIGKCSAMIRASAGSSSNTIRTVSGRSAALNKPKGYVSAIIDNVYPPVTDLIPEYAFAKLNPVGRLDVDTTGALLLTNDGDLAHKLISPKYHVDKVYEVEVDKKLDPKLVEIFKKGIELDGELTMPADLVLLNEKHAELTLHQGKFHQVKRMFKKCEYNVLGLSRKAFAFLTVEGLQLGEHRELTVEEENKLKSL